MDALSARFALVLLKICSISFLLSALLSSGDPDPELGEVYVGMSGSGGAGAASAAGGTASFVKRRPRTRLSPERIAALTPLPRPTEPVLSRCLAARPAPVGVWSAPRATSSSASEVVRGNVMLLAEDMVCRHVSRSRSRSARPESSIPSASRAGRSSSL